MFALAAHYIRAMGEIGNLVAWSPESRRSCVNITERRAAIFAQFVGGRECPGAGVYGLRFGTTLRANPLRPNRSAVSDGAAKFPTNRQNGRLKAPPRFMNAYWRLSGESLRIRTPIATDRPVSIDHQLPYSNDTP